MKTRWLAALLLVTALAAAGILAQNEPGSGAGKPAHPDIDAVRAMTPEQQDALRQEMRAKRRAARERLAKLDPKFGPTKAPPNRAAPGTNQYDSGNFDALPFVPAGSTFALEDYNFGNRFNTDNGNTIPLPITVNTVQWFPAIVDSMTTGTGAVFITAFGLVNTAGTMAPRLGTFASETGVAAGTWNTVMFTRTLTGTGAGSIQVGMWNADTFTTGTGTGGTCAADCVGLSTVAVTGGAGHHMRVEDNAAGSNYAQITTAHALFRIIGNVVPVELMNFTIEE